MNSDIPWLIAGGAAFFIATLFVIAKAYVQGRLDGWRECDEAWREHGWTITAEQHKQLAAKHQE